MNEFYLQFKYKIGDKVWISYNDTPVQCEVIDRYRASFGRIYQLALPVAEGEQKRQTELYDDDVFATKEELCLARVKRCEKSIGIYKEGIAREEALKSKWEAQCEEKEKEERK